MNLLGMSEAAALALHTVEALAHSPNKPLSTHEIASRLDVSANHLSKVHQRLAKAGIVVSVRGPRGGFKLAKPASETTMMDVFQAIEGSFQPRHCLLGHSFCRRKECIMGGLLRKITSEFQEFLVSTTAAALAR